MAFVMNMAHNLLESLNHGELQNWKDLVLLAGVFYVSKFTLKTVCNLYSTFKVFVLPSFWPRNFPEEYGPWAVVTGCSKGIGLCYAHELAKKGMNLVLIARKVELLNQIAEDIRTKYGVQVEVIIADFGHGATIYKDIEEGLANKDIGILVNNVGVAYDRIKYFHEESEEKIWNMINVNIGAMSLMTKIILPKMESKKKGAIINVASVAAFAPQPLVTMYSATKAYVDFFSRGLSYECSDKGITVQCVCPGPVLTDMLEVIAKDEVNNASTKLFIPDANAYTAQAMSTLGFSYHTTGYWKHGFWSQTGLWAIPALTKAMNKEMMRKLLIKEKSA